MKFTSLLILIDILILIMYPLASSWESWDRFSNLRDNRIACRIALVFPLGTPLPSAREIYDMEVYDASDE